MNKINLSIVSTATTGGAGTAAFRLYDALHSFDDLDVSFIRSDLDKSVRDKNVISVQKDNSFITRLNSYAREKFDPALPSNSSKYEYISYPRTNFRIEKNEIVKKSDIINLHWVADFLNYPSFFNSIKQPVVWTLHDMNPFLGLFHYNEDKNKNLDLAAIEQKTALRKFKYISRKKNIHIVCLSEWMMSLSKSSKIFAKYPHYLIPNGLDNRNYDKIDKSSVKSKFKLDNGLPTLLFVSHDINVSRKGVDLLIKAIESIDNRKFNIITIGGGNVNIQSVNHFHFNTISNIHELNSLYSAADLVIIPSREDNLPNVMLEAFANGTPVMSFSNGGMREHIHTGENGILIDTISVESLKNGILDFLGQKYIFDSAAIKNYVFSELSAKKQADSYYNLFQSII